MQATNPVLKDVRSHTVSLDGSTGQIGREELYPDVELTWRGQSVTVELSADRYVSSSGWTDWRIYPSNAETEAQGRAFRAAAVPLVEAWLESDEYTASRRRAFAWMVRNELRDVPSAYGLDRAAETLARYADELSDEDRARFADALGHLRRVHALLGTP